MEIRLLGYFFAICGASSISRVLERIRIKQPTLYRQLEQFETELGAPQFNSNQSHSYPDTDWGISQ
ncbi:LysR family transcriptional regulator [Lacticaseibacillus hegangensis]|uniref:LysR family transcriptional regulator n=1 Tax=Lacticaseibacillus hegangensis TaxID=2486010 RepID=A0ABW4CWT8_9LACO